MRLNGKKLVTPNREIIAIPRGDGDDIILIAEAILDYKEFDALCPVPKPGVKIMKGGEKQLDFEAPAYKSQLAAYSNNRYNWTILKSLRNTPNMEWETVNYSDPTTWNNWENELKDSGFSEIELQRIMLGVNTANCLNEDKVSEARKRFLAGVELEQGSFSSHQLEPKSTPSGEAAKPGESVHQVSEGNAGTT